jgi:RNA polymerase sigma factor (sigma-70 family)
MFSASGQLREYIYGMTGDLTDSELLRRYLADDGAEAAFAALVERHLPLVYGAAFRQLNDPSLAREVVQNVFITLARHAVWLAGHPSLAGWLYRTAVHLAQHEARGEQRRRQREQIALELGTLMKVDDSLLAQITPVLDEALLELRAADREALLLRFVANKSLREVGLALGIREDAAQKRVAKALEALTERFRRRGFRVAGAAVVGLALQQATAGAVPAGLVVLTTKAALAAGAATSLGTFAMPIAKIISLTKIQTAAVCAAIALLPLGYEWQALNQARGDAAQLNRQLAGLRADVPFNERQQAREENHLAELEKRLGNLSAQNAAPNPAASSDKNLYLWDENSPYIRLPKPMLSQVRFAAFGTHVLRYGGIQRYQLPPLAGDGTPQPGLEAALGLSPDESEKFRALCRDAFAQFHALAAAHSELKEEPFIYGTTMMLKTAAFPAEGAQFRDQFRAQLEGILGSERTDAFWQQAAPVFTDLFNEFGAYKRDLQILHTPGQRVELSDSYRNSSSGGAWIGRDGRPLPPSLQAHAEAWLREVPPPRTQ